MLYYNLIIPLVTQILVFDYLNYSFNIPVSLVAIHVLNYSELKLMYTSTCQAHLLPLVRSLSNVIRYMGNMRGRT